MAEVSKVAAQYFEQSYNHNLFLMSIDKSVHRPQKTLEK